MPVRRQLQRGPAGPAPAAPRRAHHFGQPPVEAQLPLRLPLPLRRHDAAGPPGGGAGPHPPLSPAPPLPAREGGALKTTVNG